MDYRTGKQKHVRTPSITLFLLFLLIFLPSTIFSEGSDKHVLLLHSYHSGYVWTDDITKGVVDILKPNASGINLHVEYMDTKKTNFDDDYQKLLLGLLKYKYAKIKPGLIIVSDNNAFDFIRQYQSQLFPEVPVVFCGINNFRDEQLKGHSQFTGVAEVSDPLGTLIMARKMNPEIKLVYVITDHLPSGKAEKARIREQLKPLADSLEISYAADMPLKQLLDEVDSLSADSIILTTAYFQDSSGTFYEPEAVTRLISEHSRVPVYGLYAFTLGHGIVGGNLINGYAQGKAAGRLGKQILAGEKAGDIPVDKTGQNVPMFDYLELQRFGLQHKKLPSGHKMINQELSKLSKSEQIWMKEHPHIRFAPAPNYPPVEFFNENSAYSGITADFVKLMKEKINLKLDVIQYKNWAEIVHLTKQQKIDMWGAAARTAEREKYMRFTEPYIRLPAVIIVRKETQGHLTMPDLKGKRVAVIQDYATHRYIEENYPDLSLIPVTDIETGLRMVSFGSADAIVATDAAAVYYIEKNGLTNLRVAGESGYVWHLSFAVRSDWPELVSILQKGLNAITEQEKQAIFRHWISLEEATWHLSREQVVGLFGIFVGMLVATVLFWNLHLRATVRKRTMELSTTVNKLNTTMKEMQLILNNAQIGIAHVVDRKFKWINPELAKMRGMSESDLIGQNTRIFFMNDQDYQQIGEANLNQLARGERYETELRFRRGEDDSFWSRMIGQAIDPEHMELGVIWLSQDITARKELELQLTEFATTDHLTGANNRRHFNELGNREIKRSKRSGLPLSVLMLDIDHFKKFNDSHGHAFGDEALIFFTNIVQSMLRDSDILGRVGGEEFAVVLPETDGDAALHVAERIREAVEVAYLTKDGESVGITVSIGLTWMIDGADDMETLLIRADKALYEAKQGGRNRVVSHQI